MKWARRSNWHPFAALAAPYRYPFVPSSTILKVISPVTSPHLPNQFPARMSSTPLCPPRPPPFQSQQPASLFGTTMRACSAATARDSSSGWMTPANPTTRKSSPFRSMAKPFKCPGHPLTDANGNLVSRSAGPNDNPAIRLFMTPPQLSMSKIWATKQRYPFPFSVTNLI